MTELGHSSGTDVERQHLSVTEQSSGWINTADGNEDAWPEVDTSVSRSIGAHCCGWRELRGVSRREQRHSLISSSPALE